MILTANGNDDELNAALEELRAAYASVQNAWKACTLSRRGDVANSLVQTMKFIQKDIDRLEPSASETLVMSGRTPRDWFLAN